MSTPTLHRQGLTRTVLRLHRTALVVWGVFVLACVGYLVWLTEVTADSVHATLAACRDDRPGLCGIGAWRDYTEPMGWTSTFMYYSFWAVAAWAGGALIGRELESGTARLAWTQSCTPTRWLAVKLAVPAVLIVLAGAVFVPVYRWAWSAHRDLMGDDWSFPDVFAARGPVVVAYGLCALAVGTLAALLLRRSCRPRGRGHGDDRAQPVCRAVPRGLLADGGQRQGVPRPVADPERWLPPRVPFLAPAPRRDRHRPHRHRAGDHRRLPGTAPPYRLRTPLNRMSPGSGKDVRFRCADAREPSSDIPNAMSP